MNFPSSPVSNDHFRPIANPHGSSSESKDEVCSTLGHTSIKNVTREPTPDSEKSIWRDVGETPEPSEIPEPSLRNLVNNPKVLNDNESVYDFTSFSDARTPSSLSNVEEVTQQNQLAKSKSPGREDDLETDDSRPPLLEASKAEHGAQIPREDSIFNGLKRFHEAEYEDDDDSWDYVDLTSSDVVGQSTAVDPTSTADDQDEWEQFSFLDPDFSNESDPIKKSYQLVSYTTFNRETASELRDLVSSHLKELRKLQSPSASHSQTTTEGNSSDGEETVSSRQSPLSTEERDRALQIDHLTLKEAALTQYLQSNPFNDRNVLRSRRNLAEGVRFFSEIFINDLKGKLNENVIKESAILEEAIPKLEHLLQEWYQGETKAYDSADPQHCSYTPEFYLKDTTARNPIAYYTENYFQKKTQQLCRSAGIPKKFIPTITTSVIRNATQQAMNEVQSWDIMQRDMTVTFGGRTKRFRQIAVPLSASTTMVGRDILTQGVHGIVPATRADGRAPINTRMTTLVEVLDEKNEDGTHQLRLVHERLQHGINDHFHLNEPHRTEANKRSAIQLIQYGIEADPDFVRELLQKQKTLDGTPSTVFFINTNLTTPTQTPRDNPFKKGTHDERDYSRRQGMALAAVSGSGKAFDILDPDTEEHKEVIVNVESIDLRFPVNYAVDRIGGMDPGMMIGTWEELHKHNSVELQKLFGSLEIASPIEGPIGSTYQKLLPLSGDQTIPEKKRNDAMALLRDLEHQCNTIRALFNTKKYQSAVEDGDRMKMPRHIDLLVNKFREATRLVGDLDTRVINAGGCMSGKDREGVAHAEAVATVMTEKLGGAFPLSGESFTDETRAIYNTAVSLVVDNTLLVTGYGGSKNAEEVANRIGDHDAVVYAAGLSHKAKT